MKLLTAILSAAVACAAPLLAQAPLPQPTPTISPTASNTWDLEWLGITGRTYFIQCSPDLEHWIYLPTFIESGTGQPIHYGLSSSNQKIFFRLAFSDIATSNPDTADFDGDGIGNLVEINTGTDPLDLDTDDDGLTNAEELFFGTSATNPDSDGDGITDGGEIEEGTDPNDANDTPEAEWLVATGGATTGVAEMRNRTLTIPAGESRLVIVAVASEEYPIYTSGAEENFEFNDILTWDIELDDEQILAGSLQVNDRHNEWDVALANSQTLRGLEPVHFESLKVITAPPNAEGQLKIELSSTNIEDNTLPSTVMVGLLPVEIVPDYNRDGKITSADRGQISEENPFRWWVNNDDDKQGEEILVDSVDAPFVGAPPAFVIKDWANNQVDGLRDLVDFVPLHLDLKSVLEVFPSDKYQYFIKHEDGGIKFFEQPDTVLEEDEDNEGPAAYLRNLAKAKELASHSLMHATTAGVQLSAEILEAFKIGKGTLVCEMTSATESPLVLEIRKPTGESSAEIEFPIKVNSMEDMYRHANVRHIAADEGTGGLRTQLGDPGDAYPDELTNGDYFVFVHGFNVDPDAARGWHAEIFKRLHQLGSRTRFIGVSWHGDVSPDYHRAVRNAFRTSRTLNIFLPDEPDAKVTIAAHSLGNMVVGNAIEREGLEVDTYFMINAATPIEAYDSTQTTGIEAETLNPIEMEPRMTEDRWKPYSVNDGRLFASNWHELFPETDGRYLNLKWSNRFGQTVPDLAYNFYSTGEDVVENADPSETFVSNAAIEIFNGFVRHAWTQNEIMKGHTLARAITRNTHAGWDFNYEPPNRITSSSGYWKPIGGVPLLGYRMWRPDEAESLSPEELKTKPFHTPFRYEKLYDLEEGSAEAGKVEVQFDLLSNAIPAMSFAAAANPLEILNPDQGENRNFNMMDYKNGGWPRPSGDWVHSDFRDVAFSYVLEMYAEMIFQGGLDQ